MNTRRMVCVLALGLGALVSTVKPVGPDPAKDVRPPAVAGSFYPADPSELGRLIDSLLAQANTPAMQNVPAIISPHAGYVYSGAVAAHAYAVLKGRKPDRVVVIAPSHYEAFGFSSVYDGGAYSTPLGQVPVDREFAARLARSHPSIHLSNRGHAVSDDKREHALEVQLPFLQRVIGPFRLVPVVMGDQSYDKCRALGLALAKLIQGTDTLIVASSDLSHYHPYQEAVEMDRKTLRAIQEWDYLSMSRNFEQRVWEACGGGPIIAAMIAAERSGATEAKLLEYANSGDVTGDRGRVVGYGALALIKGSSAQTGSTHSAFSLSQAEKDELLRIARKSVETAVRQKKLYESPSTAFESLAQERGAFVTLTKHGDLRGCVGYVAPSKPLYLTVRDVAALAAVEDHRFVPVAAGELPELEYEISVLSPLRRVLNFDQIRVGTHGLVVRNGEQEGLLLPQVPVEQHWDRAAFLRQTCLKAGLRPEAWREADTDVFLFTALVFGEPKQQRTWHRNWIAEPAPLAPGL